MFDWCHFQTLINLSTQINDGSHELKLQVNPLCGEKGLLLKSAYQNQQVLVHSARWNVIEDHF